MKKRLIGITIVLLLPAFLSSAEQKSSPGSFLSTSIETGDPSSVWAVSAGSLFHSRDGGSHWHEATKTLPDDAVTTRVWAWSGSVFVATEGAGVFRSSDEGLHWQSASYGLPKDFNGRSFATITSIAGSINGDSLFALTEMQGVYRSRDQGATWEGSSTGLPVPFFHRTEGSLLAVHPNDSTRVYAVLRVPVTSHRSRSILFLSMDGGSSWDAYKDIGDDFHAASMTVDGYGTLRLISASGDTITLDTPGFADSPATGLSYVGLISGQSVGEAAPAVNYDIDNIAVLEDDGTLSYREFDLANRSLEFKPNANGGYVVSPIEPHLDADTGEPFQLFNDDSRSVALPFLFAFYSRSWQTMYVNSSGSVSFEKGDRTYFGTVDRFFSGVPKISAIWQDFDPEAGGSILLNLAADKAVITWNQVPLWRKTTPNTFQIVLFADGRIQLNYGAMNVTTGITGLSNGFQKDGNYVAFSEIGTETRFPAKPIAQEFSNPDIDAVRVSRRFFQTHGDDFDELVVFGASEYEPVLAGGGDAYFLRLKNDVRGIGVSLGDFTDQFGSAGRLAGVIDMNSLSLYQDVVTDPIPDTPDSATALNILGQEVTHRFGAFITFRDGKSRSSDLLGRDFAHWNYFLNTDASVMEGNAWQDNGDGTFTATGSALRYSVLDQYLMGLRSASEVPPSMLITNPEPILSGQIGSVLSTFTKTNNAIKDTTKDFGPPDRLKGLFLAIQSRYGLIGFPIQHSSRTESGGAPGTISTEYNLVDYSGAAAGLQYHVQQYRGSNPQSNYYDDATGRFDGDSITIKGTRRDVSLSDVIEIEGERVPAKGAAPTSFPQAFILLVPHGKTATPKDLAKISDIRRAWEPYFKNATDGLGTVSTEIKSGLSSISLGIAGGGSAFAVSQKIVAAASVAYGRLDGGAEATTGVAFISGRDSNGQTTTDTAVPPLGLLRHARFFVERTAKTDTGVAIAAPFLAASVTLQLRAADGSLAATSTLELSTGAQVARFAAELFPNFIFPADFRGTITLTGTQPVTAVTLRTAINDASEFLMTTLPVADLDVLQGSAAYLPHFADGGGFQTDVILLNSGSTPITGALDFRALDGTPQTLRINGADSSSLRYTIPPNGTRVFSTTGGTGPLRTGYVSVRADENQAGPIVRGILNSFQSAKLVAMTGLSPSSAASHAKTFVDLSEGHDSGLAMLNDSDRQATIRLTLLDTDGQAVQTSSTTLGAKMQSARFISQFFTHSAGFRGTVDITSDVPLQIMTLRSTATSDRVLLAAFPVQSLDVPLTDRVLFFPHLVEGSGFTTEVFLMNLGTRTSKPVLSFVSQRGDPQRLSVALRP